MGFTDGHGSEKGAVMWICQISKDKTVSVRPHGTFELRKKQFLEASKYIGKKLTVRFQGYTKEGSLRFPRGKAIRENY